MSFYLQFGKIAAVAQPFEEKMYWKSLVLSSKCFIGYFFSKFHIWE